MPCLRKETIAKLIFNVICITAKFFFLFFYLFSLFLAKLFTSFFRTQDEYEDEIIYEEEEDDETMPELEEDDEHEYRCSYMEGAHHLVADIINDGDALVFHPKELHDNSDDDERDNYVSHIRSNSYDSLFQDPVESFDDDEVEEIALYDSENSSMSSQVHQHYDNDEHDEVTEEEHTEIRLDSNNQEYYESSEFIEMENTYKNNHNNHHVELQPVYDGKPSQKSPRNFELKEIEAQSHNIHGETEEKKVEIKEDTAFTRDEKFLIFAPPKSEAKKMQSLERENEVIFEDTYTVGSTSKSSSDWRSSIRDSGTDDPFSSSSRRSCPKWESYAVYQKYDEEMMFLDRISAQKLHETESLRSFMVEPRSISQRIVEKLGTRKKKSGDDDIYKNNPYNELEVAYVGQICIAWETLNWNYTNFKRKQVSRGESLDLGCPAYIAQQFQQFQVLLQRYIESEPYERGKRPEIYTRMRSVAPKLLQVPEYLDYEGEEKEVVGGRIASALFLQILEDAIQTFMNFLKADRETHCQLITALFKQRPRRSIDPAVINVFKKHIKKKKLKLSEVRRSGICFRKRKLAKEEEMEILMSLIDLKVVSRVLRMKELTQQQLNWCEAKMSKLRVLDGKLQRDSSPVFFPAH